MLILIDGNAVGHAHHNGTVLTHGDFQTQAIFGYVRMLRDLRVRLPQARINVLWDGYAQRRFDIFSDYKGDRARAEQDDPEVAARRSAYRQQVPVIKRAVSLLGIGQIVCSHAEADDVSGLLCRKLYPGVPKTLMTGDTDWLQLVDESTSWVDTRGEGKRVDLSTFHESTGFHTPAEFLEGKILQGDGTDSIPGIPDMGPKTASEFIAKWRTIDGFYAAVDAGTHTPATRKSKAAKSLHPEQVLASPEGRAMMTLNRQLMDLREPFITGADLQITRGEFDALKFRTLCDRLRFVSITKSFDEWIGPFALLAQQRKQA